ncbi:hypothetical protein R1flu_026563 [Riccia fluitans]|uniref:Tubby C-terminal domain-containing protein n=1 Tax=Riccia fluitans TaxID=41844 RepID=A0ABD1XGT9_9MARC
MCDSSEDIPEHEQRIIRGVWQPRTVDPKQNISPCQPAPKERLVQCFIVKDPVSQAFCLFLQLSPQLSITNKGKFLLAAREINHVSRAECSIWSHLEDLSEESEFLIGKLVSNLSRTEYVLYDLRPCRDLAAASGCLRLHRGVPPGSVRVLEVHYNVSLGKPQQFKSIIHTVIPFHATDGRLEFIRAPDSTSRSSGRVFPADSGTEDLGKSEAHHVESEGNKGKAAEPLMDKSASWPGHEHRTLEASVGHSKSDVSMHYEQLSSDLKHGGKKGSKEDCAKVKTDGGESLILKTKAYEWDDTLKIYYAKFSGRGNVHASSKNFQMCDVSELRKNNSDTLLQFGEVNSDLYFMDYAYPLTAFEAFSICLPILD